ncbi:MAG TPA: MBL fold metallo-hydrolase, partial [Candidatus Dojkabacteria bacterium]|nr:MBL fold metallo-hydrolase [Candidatus Dojkabacteria bacterium]
MTLLILANILYTNIQGYDFIVNLKVGQGDSALVSLGSYKLLIDGGPGDYVIHEIGKYMGGDRNIDLVILTHLHADHLLGLLVVLDYYHIDKFVMNNVCLNSPEYKLLIKKLSDQKVPIVYTDYVRINVLDRVLKNIDYSKVSDRCQHFSNLNNSSVITLIEVNAQKYLFMGDAEL